MALSDAKTPVLTPQQVKADYVNRGLTRRAFARELGIAEHSLRRYEAGLGIRPATAKKIADKYGLKVTDLLPIEDAAA